jgi:hypothetical protein
LCPDLIAADLCTRILRIRRSFPSLTRFPRLHIKGNGHDIFGRTANLLKVGTESNCHAVSCLVDQTVSPNFGPQNATSTAGESRP